MLIHHPLIASRACEADPGTEARFRSVSDPEVLRLSLARAPATREAG